MVKSFKKRWFHENISDVSYAKEGKKTIEFELDEKTEKGKKWLNKEKEKKKFIKNKKATSKK